MHAEHDIMTFLPVCPSIQCRQCA